MSFSGKAENRYPIDRLRVDSKSGIAYNGRMAENGEKPIPPEDTRYRQLLNNHLAFIEKQCFHVVRSRRRALSDKNHIDIENEVLELSNRVLDQLSKNGFRALKRFKNRSRFTTYLSTIVANQAVDIIRKKRGRDRSLERARQFGELGRLIHRKIVVEGLSVEKAYREIGAGRSPVQSREEFFRMAEKIRGSRENPVEFVSLDTRAINPENATDPQTGTAIFSQNRSNPENVTMDRLARENASEMLDHMINGLSGEERLLLRMRYPGGDEDPLGVADIAGTLGISEKAVYKRIKRVLNKCQKMFQEKGVDFHDLF